MELPFCDDNKKDVELNVVKLKYKPMIYIYIYFFCQKPDVLGKRNRRKNVI